MHRKRQPKRVASVLGSIPHAKKKDWRGSMLQKTHQRIPFSNAAACWLPLVLGKSPKSMHDESPVHLSHSLAQDTSTATENDSVTAAWVTAQRARARVCVCVCQCLCAEGAVTQRQWSGCHTNGHW